MITMPRQSSFRAQKGALLLFVLVLLSFSQHQLAVTAATDTNTVNSHSSILLRCTNALFDGRNASDPVMGSFINPLIFEEEPSAASPDSSSSAPPTQKKEGGTQLFWIMEFCNMTSEWPMGFKSCSNNTATPSFPKSYYAATWGPKDDTSCTDAFTEIIYGDSSYNVDSNGTGGNVTLTLRSPTSGKLLTVFVTCLGPRRGVEGISFGRSITNAKDGTIQITGALAALCPTDNHNGGQTGGANDSGGGSSHLLIIVLLTALVAILLALVVVLFARYRGLAQRWRRLGYAYPEEDMQSDARVLCCGSSSRQDVDAEASAAAKGE